MFSLLNFRNINKIFNFQLIIFFAWVVMWTSINAGPGELGYMFKDKNNLHKWYANNICDYF